MVRPCLENVTKSHTEMDTHRKTIKSKGRPKTAWIRSVIAELFNMALTIGVGGEVIAQDRKGGEMTLWPYVPHGDEENKQTFFWTRWPWGPADGWRCTHKSVMPRQIQVLQPHTNESGFAINKYMLGSRYP